MPATSNPVNVSYVVPPKWTGANGEIAILVSRGEPRRTNLQMEQAVAAQVQDYLLHYGSRKASPVLIALATQLIAGDYITPVGSQHVTLTREHLLAYAQVARKDLGEAAKGEI